MTGLPANVEIREKSGNQFLSQIGKSQGINFCLKLVKARESIFVSNWGKSGNFQFLTKSQGKWGKVREKLFVAMITLNNVFFIVYFNFYYL